MENCCDLHTHSVYSDGTLTPRQLLQQAQEIGLSAIALTDHNTVSGLPEFLSAAKDYPVEGIAGVEFSTDYEGTELHILALYLKPKYFSQVTELMEQYCRRKEQSNLDLVEKLNLAGYAVDYAKIKASTPEGQVNRAHIAMELTRNGYTASRQEAFQKLLNPSCGYYIPPQRFTPKEMLGIIRDMGAVSVLAHPYLNLEEARLRTFLSQAKSWGLQGMEVYYSNYDEATTEAAMAAAADFGLLYSGGSDFHGGNKPDIVLGRGRGNLKIPATWAEKIRENAQK